MQAWIPDGSCRIHSNEAARKYLPRSSDCRHLEEGRNASRGYRAVAGHCQSGACSVKKGEHDGMRSVSSSQEPAFERTLHHCATTFLGMSEPKGQGENGKVVKVLQIPEFQDSRLVRLFLPRYESGLPTVEP